MTGDGHIDTLRADLAAAGKNPDAVQWGEDPHLRFDDGVYLCYSTDTGFAVTSVSRGVEGEPEVFDGEAAAADELRRRLLRPHVGRSRTDSERAESVTRMQAKAQEILRARDGGSTDG